MQTLPHAAPHRHRNDQQGGQERTVSWRPWQPWQPQPRGVPLHMAWRQFLMEGNLCEAASLPQQRGATQSGV